MSTGDAGQELARTIERLSSEVAAAAAAPEVREAAARTSGVPVHADLGAVLVLATDGTVLRYDPDAGEVRALGGTPDDDRWRLLALVKAAKQFPELSHLRPDRPDDAVPCGQCGGRGVMLEALDCGACAGTGWIQEGRSAHLPRCFEHPARRGTHRRGAVLRDASARGRGRLRATGSNPRGARAVRRAGQAGPMREEARR
jgi:hypothetical protein